MGGWLAASVMSKSKCCLDEPGIIKECCVEMEASLLYLDCIWLDAGAMER